MIKTFHCSNGKTFATSKETMVSVDEVIAFLEKHRGKMFWNGAAGETSFITDNEIVTCDELEYHITQIEDEDYADYILGSLLDEDEENQDDSDYPDTIPMDF